LWWWKNIRRYETIVAGALSPNSFVSHLRTIGYRSGLLRTDFVYGSGLPVPLACFAQAPADARSACIAILNQTNDVQSAVDDTRRLGAPIVLVCHGQEFQWWKQGTTRAQWIDNFTQTQLPRFFDEHRKDFSPEAVYRAKTIGRAKSEYQLSFVDLGLMPIVEQDIGRELSALIERQVTGLKSRLGFEDVSAEQGHWLLKTIFWLLSGKILRDKQVESFQDLDLLNIDDVFHRVGMHYGTSAFVAGSNRNRDALLESATSIDAFTNLAMTSAESLSYVYENTLVTDATRTKLGTHSTPTYLVDYILGLLSDWIKEIPENERSVFEPACGHSAFLVSAMRLLSLLLASEKSVPSKRGPYLRQRLHGTDTDDFALELARLSLTLTDIPNPDGWDLRKEDMFIGDRLSNQSKGKTILLANPPFGNFSQEEQHFYNPTNSRDFTGNKAAEVLRCTLPYLPEGGVFGVVMPQSILHAQFARPVREMIVRDFEIQEIALFPDNMFSFADVESTILIGRRKKAMAMQSSLTRYRRVREWQMDAFRTSFEAPSTRLVEQTRFSNAKDNDFRIPDLDEVWQFLATNPRASSIAAIHQGMIFKGKNLPPGTVKASPKYLPGFKKGFLKFEAKIAIHELPNESWLNVSRDAVRANFQGAVVNVSQVLLNYAPVSRSPWRFKALFDEYGHAVTSRFVAIRPKDVSVELLWAIFNSPIANAFAFSYCSKRENQVGLLQQMPIPAMGQVKHVETVVQNYLKLARTESRHGDLIHLLREVDAMVLGMYALPKNLEASVLGLFDGWKRKDVAGCSKTLIPSSLLSKVCFGNFVQFDHDWKKTNRRRGQLITKDIAGHLAESEKVELEELQAYADYYLEKNAPRPTAILEALERKLFTSNQSE